MLSNAVAQISGQTRQSQGHRLRHYTRFESVRGMFVALTITPQARLLAADRGIECREVDYDELRGIESSSLRLF